MRLFVNNAPDVYRVSKWEIRNGVLVLRLSAIASAEPMTVDVASVDQCEMRLDVRGVDREWSHGALLFREGDVLRKTKLSQKIAKEVDW